MTKSYSGRESTSNRWAHSLSPLPPPPQHFRPPRPGWLRRPLALGGWGQPCPPHRPWGCRRGHTRQGARKWCPAQQVRCSTRGGGGANGARHSRCGAVTRVGGKWCPAQQVWCSHEGGGQMVPGTAGAVHSKGGGGRCALNCLAPAYCPPCPCRACLHARTHGHPSFAVAAAAAAGGLGGGGPSAAGPSGRVGDGIPDLAAYLSKDKAGNTEINPIQVGSSGSSNTDKPHPGR